MFMGWYGGINSGLPALALPLPAFKHYFANPINSFTVRTSAILRLLFFPLALVPLGVMAQTPTPTPRTIRVVMDNAYAPYSFQSDEGKLQGILIDQWQAWEKKTGIKAEIHGMDWDKALRRMRAGEFDVIDNIVETADRREYFDFTQTYATNEASIFFRKDIAGISDLASLKGFPIAVKDGDQHVDQLKANGVTTAIVFQSDAAIVEAAKQHKINVFLIDDPSALYLLNKLGIEEEFRHSAPIFRDELRRAVRKGDAATLRKVEQGFVAIDPAELKQIDEKWFGRTINRYGQYLTYAAYAAAAAILLIAILIGWNRMLRRKVLQRTAALGESEERFRQIAENIHEVFWLTTVDASDFLYISPAYEAVWGRSCESLFQDPRSFIAGIHPEDKARVVESLGRDREQNFEIEYRVVRPDGSIRWIRDRAFPIKDEVGRFYRIAGIAEDVTERKQAQETVRKAEQRFRTLVENSTDGIALINAEGATMYASPAFRRIFGLTVEEAQTLRLDLIHPEDQERVLNAWNELRATPGKLSSYQYRFRYKDGTWRWLDVTAHSLFADPAAQALVVNFRDITNRKQAEELLRHNEDRLRLAIDAIPTMVWSVRPDGIIDTLNQRWLDYTGISLEPYLKDPMGPVHPEDVPRVIEKWRAHMVSEEPYEAEMRLRRADGEYRWFLVRTAPLHDEQGRLVQWYGAAIDIEDRKRAEEKLKQSESQLAEAQRLAHVGSWEWNIRTNAVTWSDELYRIFGIQKGKIRVGGDATPFIHPEDRDLVSSTVKAAVKNREPYSFYYRVLRPGGDERIVQSRGQVVSDEQGEPIRILGATQDVTELKHAEEKLKATSQQLRALSARMQSAREEEGTRIAREIHDELGSALTTLKWDLEQIESVLLDPKPGPELESMKEKAKAMTRLVESTIDVVRRISADLRPSVLDDLGLAPAIEWQSRLFRERTGIAVRCHCPVDEVGLNQEQSTAVFRIFQEALTNIRRHSRAAGVDVTIVEKDDAFVLTIRDDGRGITDREKFGQSAIGLLGMRERAHLIGGEIEITGIEGAGTTVTVRLPLLARGMA
jgi:PAS domain S-box-containing protein